MKGIGVGVENHLEYEVVPSEYVPKSDIEDFFKRATEQGFYRHTSFDMFNHYKNELRSRIWFAYNKGRTISVFGIHTQFPRPEYYGTNAYNILDKSAVLQYDRPRITPKDFYQNHQSFIAQVWFRTYISWLDTLGEDYVTVVTSQRNHRPPYYSHYKLMERYEKMGFWTPRGVEVRNRTSEVDVFSFDKDKFLKLFEPVPKWNVTYPSNL